MSISTKIKSICKNCNAEFTHDSYTIRLFCNSSCAATFNNSHRKHTTETKLKITKSLARVNKVTKFTAAYYRSKIVGEYSKLFKNTCNHCNNTFISRKNVKYCKLHDDLYKDKNRNKYRFGFSLNQYPDIFGHAMPQLKEVGMRSPTNINGMTRDHKVSVNDAIKNDYDPYYITHPLNCELMLWLENISKNTSSSLLYNELVELVNVYDKNALLR